MLPFQMTVIHLYPPLSLRLLIFDLMISIIIPDLSLLCDCKHGHTLRGQRSSICRLDADRAWIKPKSTIISEWQVQPQSSSPIWATHMYQIDFIFHRSDSQVGGHQPAMPTYVEVTDQTLYLVGNTSDWDPGSNHPFFPCSLALVLWTTENTYATLDYSIIYTCT